VAKRRAKPPAEPPSPPSGPPEEGFVRAILADPDDDTHRLVYADWLEENGQPERAEFIRLQVERARRPPHDPTRWRPGERERALEPAQREQWMRALPASLGCQSLWFERGVPAWAICEIDAFVLWDESAWRAAPIIRVQLSDVYAQSGDYRDPQERAALLRGIAGKRELAHLRGLSFSESGLVTEDLAVLLASPHLTGLRELCIDYHSLGGELIDMLSRLPGLGSLTHLTLMGEALGVEDLEALLAWPVLRRIRVLGLGQNDFGDEGVELLAASARLRNLEELNLLQSDLTDVAARALASSRHLAGLAFLDLLANDRISDAGQAVLRQRLGERVNFTGHG